MDITTMKKAMIEHAKKSDHSLTGEIVIAPVGIMGLYPREMRTFDVSYFLGEVAAHVPAEDDESGRFYWMHVVPEGTQLEEACFFQYIVCHAMCGNNGLPKLEEPFTFDTYGDAREWMIREMLRESRGGGFCRRELTERETEEVKRLLCTEEASLHCASLQQDGAESWRRDSKGRTQHRWEITRVKAYSPAMCDNA